MKNAVVVYVFFVSFFIKVDEYSRIFYLFFTHGKFDFYLTVFDEIMNWFLFFALAYLLPVSAPNWVRSFSWKPSWREILKITKVDLNENKS